MAKGWLRALQANEELRNAIDLVGLVDLDERTPRQRQLAVHSPGLPISRRRAFRISLDPVCSRLQREGGKCSLCINGAGHLAEEVEQLALAHAEAGLPYLDRHFGEAM